MANDTSPPRPGPGPRPTWSSVRVPGSLGWVLMAAGMLMLSYVAALVWGSGLTEAAAQQELSDRWRSETQPIRVGQTVGYQLDDPVVAEPAPEEPALEEPALEEPAPVGAEFGEPIAQLEIPAIALTKTIVFGTDRLALQSGPGLYPSTAWPGRSGNSAIAGHRTTYGAPFQRIDELSPGDEITVETQEGRFTYLVEDPGHIIVTPEDVDVLADRGDNRLTLTSCHPLYSAKQRIVVTAVLVGPPAGIVTEATPEVLASPVAELETTIPVTLGGLRAATHPELLVADSEESFYGLGRPAPRQRVGPWWDVARWAATSLAIAGLTRIIELRWRRWPTVAVAVPPLALSLMTFFVHLNRALPLD